MVLTLFYLMVAFYIAVVATIMVLRHLKEDYGRLDGDDYVVATLAGIIASLLWPVTLVGYMVYRLARSVVEA